MAWASGMEAKSLAAQANAFGVATGRQVSLTIDTDLDSYRHDLLQTLASDSPPDVCMVASRDSLRESIPARLSDVAPTDGSAPRSVCRLYR